MRSTLGDLVHLSRIRADGQISNSIIDALICFFINKTRSYIYAYPETYVEDAIRDDILKSLDQLLEGRPLPYITGKKAFYGFDYNVTPDVLIPRPETELLIDIVLDWVDKSGEVAPSIIDVGTGSGIIGITLAKILPECHVSCVDISKAAIEIARSNAKRLGVLSRTSFLISDLFDNVNDNFDVITTNLPYIDTQTLRYLDVNKWEPSIALDGGNDGLELFSRFFHNAPNFLKADGIIILEIGYDQKTSVIDLARCAFPQKNISSKQDLSGNDRVIIIQ